MVAEAVPIDPATRLPVMAGQSLVGALNIPGLMINSISCATNKGTRGWMRMNRPECSYRKMEALIDPDLTSLPRWWWPSSKVIFLARMIRELILERKSIEPRCNRKFLIIYNKITSPTFWIAKCQHPPNIQEPKRLVTPLFARKYHKLLHILPAALDVALKNRNPLWHNRLLVHVPEFPRPSLADFLKAWKRSSPARFVSPP